MITGLVMLYLPDGSFGTLTPYCPSSLPRCYGNIKPSECRERGISSGCGILMAILHLRQDQVTVQFTVPVSVCVLAVLPSVGLTSFSCGLCFA